MDGDRERVGAMYRAYRAIMSAAKAGKISPQAALQWARRAARGEPVQVLAALSAPPEQVSRQWRVEAAQGDLGQRVLDILMRLVDELSGGAGDSSVDPEFRRLFPPSPPGSYSPPAPPLIYRGEGQGQRGRRPVTSWDGYTMAAAGAGGISDEEADALFPPLNSEQADRRARVIRARSQRVEDMADEELHRLLFGDTTIGEADE